MRIYAERIHALRSKLGLSQDELAERAGISQRQVSRYENGVNDPTGDALIALAAALHTSTDYLLGVTDDPSAHIKQEDLDPKERRAITAWRRGDIAEAVKIIVNG